MFKNQKNALASILLLSALLVSCAPENDTQTSNDPAEKEVAVTPDYVKFYAPETANKIGAYLSARIARFHYDFDAAASHAVRAFELDKHKSLYIQDQGVRLSITKQGFETSSAFAHSTLKKSDGKVTPFIALVAMVDHISKNKPKDAIAILEKYGEEFNIPVNALIGSLAYYQDKNIEQTQKQIDYLGNYELFEFLKLYHKALIAMTEKDNDKAMILLTKAQKYHDPMAARAALIAAWIKQNQGKSEDAKKILSHAEKRYPDYIVSAALKELEAKGSFTFFPPETAQDVLAEAIYKIGIIYARENDHETALAFFFMSDHIMPDQIHIESAIAETFASVKNYTRSIEFFKKITNKAPKDIRRDATLNIIFALNASGKGDQAEETLKDAIADDPDFAQYHQALGDLYRQQEKFLEAVNEYNTAFKLTDTKKKKSSWRLHYVRGIAYERMKNWPAAEKDLLQAMEYVPNNAEVVNYLAYSWIDREMNLEKALMLLDKAVRRAPENGYIVDSLGWAYYNLGQAEKAVEVLARAVELTPGDPTINEHMGDAFWKVGRMREAYFQWQHALQFDPEEKDKERLTEKMDIGLTEYLERHKDVELVKAPAEADLQTPKMNNTNMNNI